MGSLGGLMRSLLIVGAVLVTTDFIHGLYSLNRPYWYYKEDSELYNGGRRSRRSPHNPHNIYRRQADLEVPSAMLYPHCQVWSQENYRTFDGLMYVSDSACEVMLLQVDEMFSINSINDPNCGRPISGDCTRKVKFDFLFDVIDPIYLLPESEGGGAVRGGEQLSLPFYDSTLGIVIIPMNNYIVVELGHYGLSLIYDCQNYISIVVLDTSLIEGMVTGLCGDLDDDPSNDLIHRYGLTTETESISFYTNSWIVGECDGEPDVPLCTEIVSGLPLLLDPTTSERKASAEAQCDYLKDESVFGPCHDIEGLNVQEYVDACYADVCAMDEDSLDGASCSSIAAYVQECSRHFGGAPGVDWRTETICPYTCPEGLVYMPCPSACNDNSCNSVLHCDIDNNMGCIEGCRCPEGQFMKDGVCTSKDECPCEHLGESIPAGSTIEDDCNTCECSAGKLQCTTDICPATCSISGDPHFKTFDNKQFNFQGDCMYTLLTDCWNSWDYDTEYAIRAENTICGTRGYACIKAVTIEYGSKTVRLGRGHAVTLDGDIIDSFPHLIDDIYIDVATETTSVVHLGNGVSLIWDGINRLEIHVQPEHYNHTCGLCGTFTMNQNDDFYTAAGDTESNPQSFGNKWKYGSACKDVPIAGPLESCSINTQRRTVANDECSVLQSEAFSACHAKVSPTPYVDNCKIDVCSCKLKDDCHCAMIADYASECWRKGVQIDWRNVSSECGIEPCQAQGLRYTQCMDSCQSSCAARSFSSEYNCHNVCIEGCVCPEGQIRGMTGNCIKPDKCECVFEGELFMAGESRMERCGFCTCEKGGWTCELDEDCEDATCGENEEFVACLSPCPKTCNNVNNYEGCYIAYDNCTSGCQCQGDKMLHNGKCIPISSCPCYHGGLTYQVADKVKQKACRECTCSDEGWNCVTLDHCIGSCVAWGDPHFKTFDSKTYDFQGDCEYILAETVSGAAVAPFHIIIKSIPCGSSGVTCTKSIALTIGDPEDAETVFLVRGRDTPVTNFPFSHFRVESVGSYVFVFTQIGITLMWDKGTFLEVQIAPHFKGQVQGLCGNYDDNADNDFMTRSGGKASDDPILFSNGWKVHDYCADPPSIEDACDLNPHRRAWAYRRCNELRSDRFKLCHAKVDVAEFYKKCVFDACGCDMGGDCDCLCTAIAAYAYECNKFGVPVEWRRQDVCPIQCEECERYDPCISPCEYDCDLLDLGDGSGECNYTCVEGCTCPPGQYYRDGECVQDCEVYTTTPLPTTTKLTTTLETTTEVVTTPPPSTTVETTTPKITTPPIPSTSPRTSPVSSTPPSPTEILIKTSHRTAQPSYGTSEKFGTGWKPLHRTTQPFTYPLLAWTTEGPVASSTEKVTPSIPTPVTPEVTAKQTTPKITQTEIATPYVTSSVPTMTPEVTGAKITPEITPEITPQTTKVLTRSTVSLSVPSTSPVSGLSTEISSEVSSEIMKVSQTRVTGPEIMPSGPSVTPEVITEVTRPKVTPSVLSATPEGVTKKVTGPKFTPSVPIVTPEVTYKEITSKVPQTEVTGTKGIPPVTSVTPGVVSAVARTEGIPSASSITPEVISEVTRPKVTPSVPSVTPEGVTKKVTGPKLTPAVPSITPGIVSEVTGPEFTPLVSRVSAGTSQAMTSGPLITQPVSMKQTEVTSLEVTAATATFEVKTSPKEYTSFAPPVFLTEGIQTPMPKIFETTSQTTSEVVTTLEEKVSKEITPSVAIVSPEITGKQRTIIPQTEITPEEITTVTGMKVTPSVPIITPEVTFEEITPKVTQAEVTRPKVTPSAPSFTREETTEVIGLRHTPSVPSFTPEVTVEVTPKVTQAEVTVPKATPSVPIITPEVTYEGITSKVTQAELTRPKVTPSVPLRTKFVSSQLPHVSGVTTASTTVKVETSPEEYTSLPTPVILTEGIQTHMPKIFETTSQTTSEVVTALEEKVSKEITPSVAIVSPEITGKQRTIIPQTEITGLTLPPSAVTATGVIRPKFTPSAPISASEKMTEVTSAPISTPEEITAVTGMKVTPSVPIITPEVTFEEISRKVTPATKVTGRKFTPSVPVITSEIKIEEITSAVTPTEGIGPKISVSAASSTNVSPWISTEHTTAAGPLGKISTILQTQPIWTLSSHPPSAQTSLTPHTPWLGTGTLKTPKMTSVETHFTKQTTRHGILAFTTPVPSTTSSLSPTPVSTSESPTPGPTTTSLKTTGSQTPTPGPTSTFPPESTAGPTTSGPTPTGPLESTTGPTASGPTPTGPPESTAAPTTSGPTPTGPPGSTTGPTTSGPTPTGPPESTAAPTTSGPTPTGPPGSTTGPTASGPTPTGPVGSTTGPTASGPTPTGPPGSTTGPTVSGPTPTGPPGSTTGPTASGPTPTGPPESTAGPTTSGPTPTGPPGSTAGPTTSTSPPETTTVLSSTTRIFSGGTVKEKTPPTVTIPVFTEITTEETTPYSPTQGLPTPQIITGPTEITQPKVISTVATTGPLCYKEVCEYSEWRSDEQETGSEVTDKTFTETELLTDLEELYDDVCANPRAIECRIVGSEEDYSSTGEEVHCDTKEGLRCINNANTTIHCSDYEIRVECCKKVAVPCTTPPISAESTTSESTTSLTSASTEVTTETPCVTKCEWTDWCDDEDKSDKSGKPIFGNEAENKDTCNEPVCDEPTKIECVTTLDELPFYTVPGTTCDLNSGLYCDVSVLGVCTDFKVRYYCCSPCVTQTPEVVTTPVRTTVPTSPPTTLVTTTGEITSVTVPHTTNITTATTFQTTTAETTTAETTAATTAVSTQEPCLPCEIHHLENTTYEVDGCITEPISLPICGGSCPSSYSYKKSATGVLKVDQSCSCCTRANYEERQVKATCTGGPSTVMVEFVTACSCKASTCTV